MQEPLQPSAALPHPAGAHDVRRGGDTDASTDGHSQVNTFIFRLFAKICIRRVLIFAFSQCGRFFPFLLLAKMCFN